MICGDLILQCADSVGTLYTGFYWVAYDLWRPHTPMCRQCQHSLYWVGSTGQHMTCGDLIPQSADSVGTLCTGLGSAGQLMTSGDLIHNGGATGGARWTGSVATA